MKKILVVAPHPDDETLGCGGTLLKERDLGNELSWLILTEPTDPFFAKRRAGEIQTVSDFYRFKNVRRAGYSTTTLDTVPMAELVEKINGMIRELAPHEIYIPFAEDAHSDHRVSFQALAAATKWFRAPSIRRILAYETLSETDAVLFAPRAFQPNVFVDISEYLDEKCQILKCYDGETGAHPFPRSLEAVRAQAVLRGAAGGAPAAESFQLLREFR